MPELPEVDHVVQSLQPITGETLHSLMPGNHHPPTLTELADINQLAGYPIKSVTRRGKWIVIETSDHALLVHLRLTGSLLMQEAGSAPPVHHRWTLQLSEHDLALADPRGFGTIEVRAADTLEEFFRGRLGREPVDASFDGDYLQSKGGRRSVAIKTVLLDQKVAAGAGNIYVDEALFAAGIDPHESASALGADDYERLAASLVQAIQLGIARGGTSVRNYMHADGSAGTNQLHLMVYGRRAQPCHTCGRSLRYDKIGGRGTVWCAHCQPQKAT